MEKKYYTIENISTMLGVHPKTVASWIDGGKLKGFKTPGGWRRVVREDLIEFLEKFRMPIPDNLRDNPKKRILIIDDDEDYAYLLKKELEDQDKDYEIEIITSGIEALLKIGDLKPHLILLDIFMPGLDGFEVCRKIKENPNIKNTNIVAITAHFDPEVKKKALEAGASDCLSKPVDLSKIEKYI